MPPGYREEWTRHFAQIAGDSEASHTPDGEESAVVIFRIGEEWLALPVDVFEEVAPPRTHHSLPHRREALVWGIVNVRGELLVCVSLAALLGVEAKAGERNAGLKTFARLVVVGREGARVAFPVDEVHGIHRYGRQDVVAVPATVGRSGASFTAAMIRWDKRLVAKLDGTMVLDALDRGIA
nr:chemotaxis protein CheW [Ancylobacter crimeensis]